jgi:drug/metabolite transporter (DMT)-like permease
LVEIHLTQWPYIRWKRESLSEKAIGGIALGVSTLAGSTFASFAKQLRSTFSALSLLFVSELLSAFFVIFSFGFVPVVRSFLKIHHDKYKWLLLMAMFSGIGGPLLWFTGLSTTSAVNASFFSKSEMIFLMVLASTVLKEKITRAHIAAIASVLTGIIFISLHGFTEAISFRIGDILIITSALCYAAGNITFRNKLHGIEPHIALLCRSMLAITTFFIVSPFIEIPFIVELELFSLTMIPVLLGFAFVSRFLNSVTYYVAIDRIPVSTVSLVSTLDIIGSTAFAFMYLGESIQWYHYAGGAFIILGNILLELLGTHPTEAQLEDHLKQRLP